MFRLIGKIISLIFTVAVILLIASPFYAYFIEPGWYQTTIIEASSPLLNIPASDADGRLTIVFFSDTHFGMHKEPADIEKVVDEINKQNADFVFFGGDLIDNCEEYIKNHNTAAISDCFARIQANIGKYAIFGNHDYGGGADKVFADIMEAGGFSVIINGYLPFDAYNMSISGVDDMQLGYGDPSMISRCRPDFFNIILCHEPDVIDDLLNYNIDLMLSGHTHGRQINIPYLDDYILPTYGKKYVRGPYTMSNPRGTQLYVNRGIGMTKLPFRLLARPEITCFQLLSSSPAAGSDVSA